LETDAHFDPQANPKRRQKKICSESIVGVALDLSSLVLGCGRKRSKISKVKRRLRGGGVGSLLSCARQAGKYFMLPVHSCSHISLKFKSLILDLIIEKYMRWEELNIK
jgi:hypothetical protein